MTKKLFVLALALFLITGFVALGSAEQGATSYSGKKYYEQTVFVDAWNAASTTIQQNAVVVMDSVGTLGDSAGATITTTATPNNAVIFGVADNLINGNSVGRVCVRGPHLVLVNPTNGSATYQSSFAAGVVMTSSSTLSLAQAVNFGNGGGSLGTFGLLGYTMTASTAGPGAAYNNNAVWIWVQPQRY